MTSEYANHSVVVPIKSLSVKRSIGLLLMLLSGFFVSVALTYYLLGHLPPYMLWHAALMLFVWGLVLPTGVLLARFFKVTPEQDFPKVRDNQFWWNWHRGLQYAGLILATFATWLMWQKTGMAGSRHAQLGLTLLGLGWLQAVSSWVRGSKGGPTEPQLRGAHYDMTLQRLMFEYWHKILGWSCLMLALVAMGTGFYLVGMQRAVHFGVPITLGSIFITIFAVLTKQKRWVDTYTAIWGHAFLSKQKRNP